MMLNELAIAAGVTTKWILNASASVSVPRTYSSQLARRLAVTRAIQVGAEVPLPRAWQLSEEVLGKYAGSAQPISVRAGGDGAVVLLVDVARILSEVNTRESFLRTMYAPRRRGPRPKRPAGPEAAIKAAKDWGWDVTLFESTLRRSVAERIRMMDGFVEFGRQMRAGRAVDKGRG